MATYNLEERTFEFAKSIRLFLKQIPNTISNQEDGRQLIRSSGSKGANYIEGNESLGIKDRIYRIKIARKEAKESIYWIRLTKDTNQLKTNINADSLVQECSEIKKILSSIIIKLEK